MNNGQSKNPAKNAISNARSAINNTILARITHVFTNIPIPIEKPTNPSRYSFFHGRKNVLRSSVVENNWKKDLLSDAKNASMPTGALMYQNLSNKNGYCMITLS